LEGPIVNLWPRTKSKKGLASDPFEGLVHAVDLPEATERSAMRRALSQVLSTIAASGAYRRIGACQNCTHFGRMRGDLPSMGSPAAECLLFGVPMQPEDVGLLCVHFQPMNEHDEGARGE